MSSKSYSRPLVVLAACLSAAPLVAGGCSSAGGGGGGGSAGAGATGGFGGFGGTSGTGATGGGTGATGGGTGATGGGGTGATGGGGTGATGGGGTGGADASTDATIGDITKGTVAVGASVKVSGAVAMSNIFLVSQSKTTNSCLWGVFVSAPNLTETEANSGILVLSYGTDAVVADGGTKAYCPVQSIDPTGSQIPDDIKPGDAVDISGQVASFLNTSCATQAGGTTVGQFQISKATLTKVGVAPVPSPHVLTSADIQNLVSQTNKAFYDPWGGVKVRVQNVTATPQAGGAADGGLGVTNQYGQMFMTGSNLMVGDKIYYQGYLKSTDACFSGPEYANASQTFQSIDGFVYLDFCTWGLEPNSKCADLAPPSEDCASTGTDASALCLHL